MEFGQFCPIAKANEVLGEKWTLLIIRELLMGSHRFRELQRGLGGISPTILSKRLAGLEEQGLIYRKGIQGQRGYEYHPTQSCKELLPILLAIGVWGMRWTRSNLKDRDYDVELLMLYLERSIRPEALPETGCVMRFHFADFDEVSHWWIVVSDAGVDICTVDPGKDVDLFITTSVKTMTELWMGRMDYRAARSSGVFDAQGPVGLTRDVEAWLGRCIFADLPDPAEILGQRKLDQSGL
ncbi:MAG: helix-turn-helix domain-containing protein [Kiloniellales bacterium]